MPLFSYECQKCGNTFDLLIGMTVEKSKMECPKCQSKNIVKLISAPNINVKKSDSSPRSCSTGTCPTCGP